MINKNLLAVIAVATLFTSVSYAQDAPAPPPAAPVIAEKPKADTAPSEKMNTLFNNAKNPVKYVGISFASEFQYGSLAGQFAPMSGGAAMLHINKKIELGIATYGTVNRSFAPTALSATNKFNMNVMYGGLKFEYTPKPNAAIHVSFPLLIGGGMARVDSVGLKSNTWYGGGRGKGRDGYRYDSKNGGNNAAFMVIQPGVNIEANVFRFAKIYLGASYRIVPTLTSSTANTAAYPTLTTSQLSGLNVNIGAKVGIFDYQLHQKRTRSVRIKRSERRLGR
jgi:hypothetical protein